MCRLRSVYDPYMRISAVAAQVFLVRKWSSILVICIWIFVVFSVFDPGHAYAYQCSAYSTAIFLFGGLIDYSTKDKAVNAAFISNRIAMVSIGIIEVTILEVVAFAWRPGARSALASATRLWYRKLAECLEAALALAEEEDSECAKSFGKSTSSLSVGPATGSIADKLGEMRAATAAARQHLAEARLLPSFGGPPVRAAEFEALLELHSRVDAACGDLVQGLAPVPRDTDKAELLRTLRVHATRRVAQHARAAATALEEGGCDGMVRFIAALAGYGEAGALGARDRDEATIAYWAAHPTGHYRELHIIHHAADAFATATVVGAIEGVCRDMLKSADVVPNLLLLFPPSPAATIPAAKRE